MRQLLDGLSLVELSTEVAGSYCGKVFADLGADVVKVEPPSGDPLRRQPALFAHLNTNKRSIAIGDDAPDRARLRDIVGSSDAIIESAGDGDLESFGLSRDALRAAHPALVVATVSGFGTTGPYRGYRWSDLVAQLAAWMTLPQSRSPVVPLKHPRHLATCAVGHTVAMGALAAILRARATAFGAHVDCAAYEALATIPARVCRYLGWEYRGRTPLELTATADTLLPIGVFPCKDGYVSALTTPQQLARMLDVLDDDALRAAFAQPGAFAHAETREAIDLAFYPWLASHTRDELTTIAQGAQWALTPVLEPGEVLDAAHLHQRGFWVDCDDPTIGHVVLTGPPYRHAEGGWRLHRPAPARPAIARPDEDVPHRVREPERVAPAASTDPADPPLRGIRVLDLTTVWSGPYVTQLLADLGAEVIRIENPSVFPPTTKGYLPRPDPSMLLGSLLAMYAPLPPGVTDRPYNRHAMNNSIARNKRSCTLDPRRLEARELLMQLVERSDVFVENLKTSTLHRLGIHETALLERNPRLLVLRLPAAGLTGDWANYTGFGAQFDALSGLSSLTGHLHTHITDTPSTLYMDAATGPAGAFAVLAALHYRAATGRGQLIELAQMENALNQLGDVFVECQLGGHPERLGNRDVQHAPQGVYACRGDEQWLAITVRDDTEWAALARTIGRDDWLADPRLATVSGRAAAHDELDAAISHWAVQQDAVDAFHRLQRAGVAAAPRFDEAMLATDPNVAARGWIRPLTSRDVGTHPHIGHAVQGIPQAWDRGAPALGEDNEYVYRTLLGLDEDHYRALVDSSVIVDDYLDQEGNPV